MQLEYRILDLYYNIPHNIQESEMLIFEWLLPVLLMKLKKDPNFQAAQVSLAHKHFSFFPPKPENEEKNMRKSAVFHLILSIASSDKNKKKRQLQGYR